MLQNIFAASIFMMLLTFGNQALANTDDVVATVGTKPLTLKDFNQRYEDVQKQTINPPSKEIFLEDLIRYEIGLQEAAKKKIQDEAIVQERIRQEIYKGLIEKELGDKVKDIKVNEEEMKTYYQKNPEIRTSHILIEFKPDATEEQKKAAKARAEEIFNKEVKGSKRPFEELVQLFTDDVLSKKNGGDVGWQTGLTLVPSYYNAIVNMKQGEIKGLVETQYGFHIIKLTGKHTYQEANKRQIRAAVFDEKRKKIFDEYFAKLKKNYPVKVNKSLIQ